QNKELTILESQKDSFLALGYSVIDKEGRIIEAGNATEYIDLKAENITLKSEITKLKSKVKTLEVENKKLKAAE
ncbi:MAG: hypothetical protein RR192_02105, partial [Peptostreptococcaceae bacterium]